MPNEFSKITIQLLLKEPFFGHLLTQIIKQNSTETQSITINTDRQINLRINADYWNNQLTTPLQKIGSLKHQLLHLIFQHPFHLQPLGNPILQSIALDLAVNQYITTEQLPVDAVTTALFPATDWTPFASVQTYYKQLQGILENPNTTDNYTLQRLIQSPNIQLEQHDNWLAKKSPAAQKIQQNQLQQLVQESLSKLKKRAGKLAGNLENILQETYSIKPTIHWKKVLRLFANNNAKTYLKTTIRRPSKRYGTTPGIQVKNKRQLLVAIDTSSSIQLADITAFYTEIYQLWKQGNTINIIEFDTIIQRNYPFKGQSFEKIQGRGGTDFKAILAFTNQQKRLDGILIFTDGEGTPPLENSRFPLLWVISTNGIDVNSERWKALPQRKIKLHD